MSTSTSRKHKLMSPAERISAECLNLVGPSLRRPLALGIPISIALSSALVGQVNPGLLGLWVGLVCAATAILFYVASFQPVLDAPAVIQNRRNEIITVNGVLGAAVGSVAVLAFPRATGLQSLVALVVFVSLCSLGLGTVLVKSGYVAAAVPAIAPSVVRFALRNDSYGWSVAICLVAAAIAFGWHVWGAHDAAVFLVKNRLENQILHAKLERTQHTLLSVEEELSDVYRNMAEASVRDEVTGVHTRKEFTARLMETWRFAEAGGDPFAVAMLDIDDFDGIVRQHGREIADTLLRKVADIIQDGLRTDDCLARLGTSQFAVLLANSLTDGGRICLERIRRRIASSPIDAGEPLMITTSIGQAGWQQTLDTKEILRRADLALRSAQEAGDNRFVTHGDERGASIVG